MLFEKCREGNRKNIGGGCVVQGARQMRILGPILVSNWSCQTWISGTYFDLEKMLAIVIYESNIISSACIQR